MFPVGIFPVGVWLIFTIYGCAPSPDAKSPDTVTTEKVSTPMPSPETAAPGNRPAAETAPPEARPQTPSEARSAETRAKAPTAPATEKTASETTDPSDIHRQAPRKSEPDTADIIPDVARPDDRWRMKSSETTPRDTDAAYPGQADRQADRWTDAETLDAVRPETAFGPAHDVSPEMASPRAARPLPATPLNLNIQDEDLRLILRMMARIAEQSMMISQSVSGTVSISIHNKPWDAVFLGLLKTYGLTYRWEGDIIRVMTIEDMNKELQWLDIEEEKRTKTLALQAAEPLLTRVIPIDYADAQEIRTMFEDLMTDAEGKKIGRVLMDKHTNSLVINAREKDVDRLAELARALDRPTAQIRIEARIVEAAGDTARELGVEWGGLASAKRGDTRFWLAPGVSTSQTATDTGTGGTGGTGTGTSQNLLESLAPGLIQRLPAVTAQESGLLIGFLASQGDDLLQLQLTALESEGKINILSSPSISTLDNQTAVIESGREVPFQTVEDDEVNVEFKKAVLRLEVTPHVIYGSGDANRMKMKIVTHKDELDFSNTVEGNPTVLTKRADTTIMLADGQTTVIGGLRRENDSFSESGVPVLKDIPLLGRIFKRKSNSSLKEEILIFITPRIIYEGDQGAEGG